MNKKLLLLFVLLLLTGCNATYNLEIDDDKFVEKLDVSGVIIKDSYRFVLPLEHDVDEYDEKKVNPGDNGFYKAKVGKNNYSLYNTFKYNDFKNSTLLNSCYDNVDVNYNKDDLYISTTGSFKCFEYYDNIDSIKVKITSKYKLVASNADNVDGFDYTWNIDKNNLDKGIYIEFNTKNKSKTFMDWLNEHGVLVFIFQAVLIILLVGFMLFIKKKDKEDEMF